MNGNLQTQNLQSSLPQSRKWICKYSLITRCLCLNATGDVYGNGANGNTRLKMNDEIDVLLLVSKV